MLVNPYNAVSHLPTSENTLDIDLYGHVGTCVWTWNDSRNAIEPLACNDNGMHTLSIVFYYVSQNRPGGIRWLLYEFKMQANWIDSNREG